MILLLWDSPKLILIFVLILLINLFLHVGKHADALFLFLFFICFEFIIRLDSYISPIQIVSIFNLTLPNFIISPIFNWLSSFFLEGFQERHKFDISVIFLLKYGLKIGLDILK